jgi:hypothetical protein
MLLLQNSAEDGGGIGRWGRAGRVRIGSAPPGVEQLVAAQKWALQRNSLRYK